MLDLQPIITRFVDDVLRALRGASLDELRALLGPAASSAPAPARRASASGSRKAGGRRTRRAASEAQPPARAPASPRTRAVLPPPEPAEPPTVAEMITDPEALLAAAFAEPPAPAPEEPVPAAVESEPPASAERPKAGVVTRLRAGETLAREAGAGVVIRRAKRA
jgi:hypothetical protein